MSLRVQCHLGFSGPSLRLQSAKSFSFKLAACFRLDPNHTPMSFHFKMREEMFEYLKLILGWLPPQDRRIYLSDSDFVNITQNGTLCNANGEIGLAEFHAIMRREVTLGQAIA
jgi:hypothetical protein